jgi:hypothetical protein
VILGAKLVKILFLNYSKSWILYSCASIILPANLLNLCRLFSSHRDFHGLTNAKLGHCFGFTLTGGCCKAFYFLKNNLLIDEKM